ncbi:hypothetical protein FraQA3DRAFT_1203 [Frankia sp. QA3]|nr:hypothetical protein FraQA3DRAFT_1203 [Frankia sp. QA3]
MDVLRIAPRRRVPPFVADALSTALNWRFGLERQGKSARSTLPSIPIKAICARVNHLWTPAPGSPIFGPRPPR